MARNNDRDRGTRRTRKDTRPQGQTKICIFCQDHATWVDHKDVNLLRRFISDRGKIRARRVTGNCSQHQRDVEVAIKTARELALMPYAQRTVNERGPGRGPGRGGARRDDTRAANGALDAKDRDGLGVDHDEDAHVDDELSLDADLKVAAP